MDYFMAALKKYAVFSGRSRRKEYWFFFLFYFVIAVGLTIVEAMIGTGGILAGLFMLGMIIPNLAVTIRRLHDTDRSGWWLLIGFVPLIGAIVILVFMFTAGTAGPNRFGEDPKAGVAA